MNRLCPAILAAALAAPPAPLFRFHTDEFWLNEHHFLYVLGRAEAKMRDATREAVVGAPADAQRGLATLSSDELKIWTDAVAFYAAGPSKRDAIFDAQLPKIAHALAQAVERPNLSHAPSIEADLRATLERAAPVYRKTWWPAHRAANTEWRDAVQTHIDRHGQAVLAFITRAYGMEWPADGFPVHLSGYANWAGAYSTDDNLLVISSLDRGTRGLSGLETVFHEAMHQWDGPIQNLLSDHARRAGKRAPPGLSHALIWVTAGEAVRRVVPGYVPNADTFGIWQRGMQSLKGPVETAWKPYLDGQGTRDEALAALIAKF
jgi:hypothetical protein